MELPMIFALVLGSIGLLIFWLYRKATSSYGYWEAQGVKTIKPKLIYGSTEDTFYKGPDEIQDERYKKYGRIYGTYEPIKRALNIADPELAHQVLIKNFHIFTNRRSQKLNIPVLDSGMATARDETWKRIRMVVGPSFTSGKMRKMNPQFMDAAEGLVDNLKTAADKDELIDVKFYFNCFSLDVIGLCAFGVRVDSLKNPDHPFAVNARKLFAKDFTKGILIIPLFPQIFKLLGNYFMKKLGFSYLVEVAKDVIQKRKELKLSGKRVDLIQLLLDAREGKDDKSDKDEPQPSGHFHLESETGTSRPAWNVSKTLSDMEVQAQSVTFFAAGHETTSTALAYVAYELALNPDIQERTFQEIQEAYKTHGEINYDVVGKMPYLDAVISETLRLHTISLVLEREASEDFLLGSTGIKVPKGGLVLVLVHCMHHDPEWFPEPYKFNPDRFLPENRASLTPYSYIPFGDGPRNCVAARFALIEIKLGLAMALREIKFVATEETRVPIRVFHNPGLLVPREIRMKVEKRN